jgi:hypothetical protein
LKDKPYTAEDRKLRLQVSQGAESVVYIFEMLAYVVVSREAKDKDFWR